MVVEAKGPHVILKLFTLPLPLCYATTWLYYCHVDLSSPLSPKVCVISHVFRTADLLLPFSEENCVFRNVSELQYLWGDFGKSHAALRALIKHLIKHSPFQRAFRVRGERQQIGTKNGVVSPSLIKQKSEPNPFCQLGLSHSQKELWTLPKLLKGTNPSGVNHIWKSLLFPKDF